MSSFVKSATVSHDIDTNSDIIDIEYVRYKAGIGYQHVREHFNTTPIGDWKHIKVVSETLRYEQFLDTMVQKTTEIRRKMALVELESALCENNNTRSVVRIMNAVKILDPTFSPPVINMKCSWQKKFVKSICVEQLPHIIETSTNDLRLEKFFRVLQLIEAESLHQSSYYA
jgi:hypothetical protein